MMRGSKTSFMQNISFGIVPAIGNMHTNGQ